jgi:hypothetical protein
MQNKLIKIPKVFGYLKNSRTFHFEKILSNSRHNCLIVPKRTFVKLPQRECILNRMQLMKNNRFIINKNILKRSFSEQKNTEQENDRLDDIVVKLVSAVTIVALIGATIVTHGIILIFLTAVGAVYFIIDVKILLAVIFCLAFIIEMYICYGYDFY